MHSHTVVTGRAPARESLFTSIWEGLRERRRREGSPPGRRLARLLSRHSAALVAGRFLPWLGLLTWFCVAMGWSPSDLGLCVVFYLPFVTVQTLIELDGRAEERGPLRTGLRQLAVGGLLQPFLFLNLLYVEALLDGGQWVGAMEVVQAQLSSPKFLFSVAAIGVALSALLAAGAALRTPGSWVGRLLYANALLTPHYALGSLACFVYDAGWVLLIVLSSAAGLTVALAAANACTDRLCGWLVPQAPSES